MAIHDITLDFAPNMDWAARQIAVNGMRIYDRFHLERLLFDAVQSLRVSYRWEALEEEESGRDTKMYSNGDTKRQLLARSRYLLFKVKNKWSSQQTKRAAILFKEFPRIKKAYELVMEFKEFFRLTAQAAKLQIELWIKRAANSGIREFITLSKTVNNHLGGIINYFYEKQTNALLENFNGKIKQLKREVRGTRDRAFFFFRLFKLFA
jgi:transposase